MSELSSVSLAVYLLALLVLVAFFAFVTEELARIFRRKESRRIQAEAWEQYHNWIHSGPEQSRIAHK
jgi:hypothetical protein